METIIICATVLSITVLITNTVKAVAKIKYKKMSIVDFIGSSKGEGDDK